MPDVLMSNRVRNLPRLTSLRWFGALAVFLFHMPQLFGWRPLWLFQTGYAGVSFFFVLSGFVLTWSRRPNERPGDFYVHRFGRIYPAMTVMLAVTILLAATWDRAPILTSTAGPVSVKSSETV